MMRLDHLAGGPCVLSFRLTVQIAGTNRRHVQQRSQRNQNNEQGMARRRRRQRRWLEQSFLQT
jgi:hypothetical protein